MLGLVVAIVSVSGTGKGPSVPSGPSGFGLAALLLLGAIAICVTAALFMVAYLWPDSTSTAPRSPKAKPAPTRCRKCGYDLRASPDYRPECGTPTPKPSTQPRSSRGPAERPTIAYTVSFHTRTESIDLRIPIDQLEAIKALDHLCPEATELILAPADRKRPTAVASEALASAAEQLLQSLQSAHASPALETALRRTRQFARKHTSKRLERDVGPSAAI